MTHSVAGSRNVMRSCDKRYLYLIKMLTERKHPCITLVQKGARSQNNFPHFSSKCVKVFKIFKISKILVANKSKLLKREVLSSWRKRTKFVCLTDECEKPVR